MSRVTNFALSERVGTRVLLTASEAYPELERSFLEARTEIWASFRIFDLATKLRSDAARAVGETWLDLVAQVLSRGVRIRFVLSDFDPIARPELHRIAWRSLRQFAAAREIAGRRADLDCRVAMHPSRTGIVPGCVVWPIVRNRLRKNIAWLNAMTGEKRACYLRDLPGLTRYLQTRPDGRVAAGVSGMPDLYPATHHQKLAVFDRRLLYIGGIDLNERRYDTLQHDRPGEETWQDVQVLTDGPVVAEAQRHLESFPAIVAGLASPSPQRRLLRTLSRRRDPGRFRFGPAPVAEEIALAHGLYVSGAKSLIYLETQFFRDRRLARRLARAGRENPDLSLLMMLPAAPEDVAFDGSGSPDARFGEFLQWRCLKIVQKAFGRRLFVGAGAQPRRPADPAKPSRKRKRLRGAELVYIHSKVSVFDLDTAIVSSANLNGRSLRWDTEAGILIDDKPSVEALRRRVFEHWLPTGSDEAYYTSGTAVENWRSLALKNAGLAPEDRKGFILPYDFKASARYGMPLPGLPEEMV